MTQGELFDGLFDDKDHSLVEKFRDFHTSNAGLYTLFCRFALQAATRRPRFSARTVLHRIRWHTSIETDDPEGFKVNNNWSPFYARLFERDHPEHVGFFERRTSAADEMGGAA